MARVIAWASGGVASAIMCKLVLDEPGVVLVNCDLGDSEDEDNHRFLRDCERWYGREIVRIRSEKYANIDEVFEARKYLSGMNGAPCTGEMKFAPRMDFQLPSDVHLFGYTADRADMRRADRMRETYPELKVRFPLIKRGLTKDTCHLMLEAAGIKRPRVYDMGYPNGNCPGCVKASSPSYWALVRKCHPEVFARRADQSRRFGARLVIIGRKDGKNVRAFIDEIPEDQPTLNATVPSCDFLCHFAVQDMEKAA